MTIAEALLPEFDHEMATTRKLLERMPEDKADWKPHPKSFALGLLCAHIADMPNWATTALTSTELDLNPPGGQPYEQMKFESRAAMLERFERHVGAARAEMARASDAEYMVGWTLKSAGQTFFTIPRVAVVRTWVLNHIIHHRGQLSVYLRELDVPIPAIYGPSADEQGM